ncbi:GNAT family N-acetyltransferase [Mangrovicoccus ximenensis]|uniref:GNAT family N-acetyltransferase n=1 Tax=Mangrovicoccus ximenensis TaxID=1911570 RepID=UPI000D3AF355|nr:GNAT family N-acetyltransferase [Mangrovicoccus ximenensis]
MPAQALAPEHRVAGNQRPIGGTRTVVLHGPEGGIAATAHCYFPHGPHSPHVRDAWVGLVAVAPEFRGCGLGTRANAEGIRMALDDLGATAVHELVSETNIASRRMMERCGLSRDAQRVCAMAIAADSAKFTR